MKRILLTLIIALGTITSWGQYEPLNTPSSGNNDSRDTEENNQETDLSRQSFFQRLQFGGNLQLAFGTFTFIEVSPRVGYRVTRDLTSGVGINYIYSSASANAYYPGSPRTEFSAYGGNVFSTYNVPIPIPIALHGEYEALNFEVYDPFANELNREWVSALRLGGAYVQRLGNNGGGVYLMALYDVLYDPDRSLYGSPWTFRISFMF